MRTIYITSGVVNGAAVKIGRAIFHFQDFDDANIKSKRTKEKRRGRVCVCVCVKKCMQKKHHSDFRDHFQFNYIAGSCILSIQDTYVRFFFSLVFFLAPETKKKLGLWNIYKKGNRLFFILNYFFSIFFCSVNYKFTLNISSFFVVSFLFAHALNSVKK